MPAFAFDKILKIVQIILTVLQTALAAFTGLEKPAEDAQTALAPFSGPKKPAEDAE